MRFEHNYCKNMKAVQPRSQYIVGLGYNLKLGQSAFCALGTDKSVFRALRTEDLWSGVGIQATFMYFIGFFFLKIFGMGLT